MRGLSVLVFLCVVCICSVVASDCWYCQTVWRCQANCDDLFNATMQEMKKDHFQVITSNKEQDRVEANFHEGQGNVWRTGFHFQDNVHSNTTCSNIFSFARITQGNCYNNEGIDKIISPVFKALPKDANCQMFRHFGC